MKMLSRQTFLTGTVSATLVAGSPLRAPAQNLTPLHVTTGVTIGAESAVYGLSSGIFKKYGLDVDITKSGAGGGSPLAALIGGTFQVDYVNTVSLAQAHSKGLPLVVIAPGAQYDTNKPYALMFVRKDSPVKSGRDLNGKTICSQALLDITAIAVFAWIDANGGDAKRVHGIELPNSAMLPALDEGRVDVIALVPPFQAQALESGKFRVLGKPFDAIAKRFQVATWAATTDYVAKNPDVARRFAAAMREASTFCNANPAKVRDLIANFTGIDPRVVAKSPGPADPAYIGPADLQPVIDVAAKYGTIPKSFNAEEVMSPVVRRT